MLKSLKILVMLGLVLGLLVAPASADPATYEVNLNFNAASDLNFLKDLDGVTPSRMLFTGTSDDYPFAGNSDYILTPFGTNPPGFLGNTMQDGAGVQLTIGVPAGPAITSLAISFQLWIINTWDGNGSLGFGPDFFQVGLGTSNGSCTDGAGQTTVFCESFAMAQGSSPNYALQSYQGPATYYGADVNETQGNPPNNGFPLNYAASGYAVYDITLSNIAVTPASTVTIFFRGLQNQSGLDESWSLSSLNIQGFTNGQGPGPGPGPGEIPEPSTLVLGGLGLGLLFLAKKRRKAA